MLLPAIYNSLGSVNIDTRKKKQKGRKVDSFSINNTFKRGVRRLERQKFSRHYHDCKRKIKGNEQQCGR